GDAAAGDHLVADGELLDHRAMLLLLLHLRTDHQEVHDREQDQEGKHGTHQAGTGGGGGGLGVGRGNEQVEQVHGGIRRKTADNYATAPPLAGAVACAARPGSVDRPGLDRNGDAAAAAPARPVGAAGAWRTVSAAGAA